MPRLALTLLFILTSASVRATAIDTVETPMIGGIKQYIKISGSNRENPILLFLHGGPGGSVLSYSDKFTSQLKDHFIVVQWDQRQTGKTFELNSSPTPLSFALFQQDTYELMHFLIEQFHQQKLYLVGHSWGTALGFQMAKQYPELIHAFVAIGAMTNQFESERIALDMLKQKAEAKKNTMALDELSAIHIPFENGEQLFYHRSYLLEMMGSKRGLTKEYVERWAETWLTVFNEASSVNMEEFAPNINCPVYFFAGRKDFQTNSWLTEKYYKKLIAPKKEFFWFERSAHGIPTSEPGLLQKILIEDILRDTYPAAH